MMTRWVRFNALAIAVTLSCPVSAAVDSARLQADVRDIIQALYRGDVDTVLALSHPWIISQMGGAASARTTVQGIVRQTQQAGLRLESLSFPEQPRIVGGSNRLFAVVPTRAVLSGKAGTVESANFQLGVLEAGATHWTYFEGSRLTPQILTSVFPDFPKGFTFPAIERKRR